MGNEREERRTCRFVALAAAVGTGALMNRGKSIRISPASTPPIYARTSTDDIVNVFIFSIINVG
jgi:hypothetical protein